jgi:hypothetical protein
VAASTIRMQPLILPFIQVKTTVLCTGLNYVKKTFIQIR